MAASEKLSNYRQKRDFAKTSEPSGETLIVATDRRRFVIQKHAATRLPTICVLNWMACSSLGR
jgi:bifunctional non-homologous end joining protein LigD